MKRLFSGTVTVLTTFSLAFASLLTPLVANASAVFSYGDGTEGNPYKISNCDQLQAISNHLDKNFEIIVNIDCDANDFVHIGDTDTPFTGYLEGNNKIIKNLSIDDSGLFGRIDNGQVHNLKLINPTVSGSSYVGSLAGSVNGSDSNIYNVHVSNGSVTGSSNYIGGLIGGVAIADLGGLNNPVVEKSSYQGVVNGPGVMGGFIGTSAGGAYIHNNYARTTLTVLPDDSPIVGGFFGINSSYQTAENYALSTIDAQNAGFNATVGGFVGIASGGQTTSFAEMDYNTGATQVGDFMGFSAGSTIGADYYADHGHGFSSNSGNPGGGAIAIDTATNPDYFKTGSNAPLSMWDTENTWQLVWEDYPILRGELGFSETFTDINGDTINDTYQAIVIGVPDAEENLTVVELNHDTDCTLDPAGSWIDSGYYKEDPYYPLQIPKMTEFTVYCPSPGAQVQVTLVYPEQYDTSNSVLRFYNRDTDQYHNVSGVEFGTREVNGNTVTTATYMLVDGGENDTDGAQDSVIHDPVGIAVDNSPEESSGQSGGDLGSQPASSSLASTGQSSLPLLLLASLSLASSMLPIVFNKKRLARICTTLN